MCHYKLNPLKIIIYLIIVHREAIGLSKWMCLSIVLNVLVLIVFN